MEEEIWKDIPLFAWYQASNLWRIRNSKRILNWNKNHWYLYINFYLKWKKAIHRLIASTFHWLDINDRNICVCHKNDIKDDNREKNLFLWTHKDNIRDCINKWRRIQWNFCKRVAMMSLSQEIIKEFNSARDAQRFINWSDWNISKCCNWKMKSYLWYKWKYINS